MTKKWRRSQEVHWVHVHSQGGEKMAGGKLQGKVVSAPPGRECTPEAEQESNFLWNWGDVDGGRGYLGRVSVCFEDDDQKIKQGRQLFWRRKCTPDKILATPIW